MEICERDVGSWITPGVTFVDSTCILWPTEANLQERPASLTITMMTFFVWRLQMQVFQKPKVKTVTIPRLLRREKTKGL